MKLLGHRISIVSESELALNMSKTFLALGLEPRSIFAKSMEESDTLKDEDFSGAIFASDEINWIEIWSEMQGVPKGMMLQLIVDDADAFAKHAKANGLDPQGPVEAHGEKIYYLFSPQGLPISFQSVIG